MDDSKIDPEVQRYLAERELRYAERGARREAAARPVVEELARIGISVPSIWHLCGKNFFPLSRAIIDILLKWLPRVADDDVKDSIVRALCATKEPFDGQALIDCFEADREESLRFSVANTFAFAHPTGIADWLIATARKRRFGSDRGLLLLAVARHLPRETAIPLLREASDDIPGYAATALGEVGGLADAEHLEKLPPPPRPWERKEIEKAIRKIRKRVEREDGKGTQKKRRTQ